MKDAILFTVATPIPKASAVLFTLGFIGVNLLLSKYSLTETTTFFISGDSGLPLLENIVNFTLEINCSVKKIALSQIKVKRKIFLLFLKTTAYSGGPQ